MNSWMLLAVALPLIGVIVWQQWLLARTNQKWMRIFCEDSLKIRPSIMEDEPQPLAEGHPVIKQATRKRISIPVPGASMFRPNGGSKPHA